MIGLSLKFKLISMTFYEIQAVDWLQVSYAVCTIENYEITIIKFDEWCENSNDLETSMLIFQLFPYFF
jgi:hypothetical protein